MAEAKKNPWAQPVPQGYPAVQAGPTGSETSDAKAADTDDATGVENVRYDKVAAQGAPRPPKNGAQVAAEGLATPAAELARPDAVVNGSYGNDGKHGSDTGRTPSEDSDADIVRGYDQQIALLRDAAARTAPETDEQRKERERRERSRKVVAAVSDGLNALGNLFFTTQYAPNLYEHKELSQLDPLRRHYERMRQEREADRDKHLQYSLRLGDIYNARDKALRGAQAARLTARLAAVKDAREAAKGDAEIARTKAQERWYDAKAKAEPVKAEASKTAANKRGSSGSGKRGGGQTAKWAVYDADGKVAKYVQTRDEAISETVRIGGKYPETLSMRETYNSITDANETSTIRTTPTADRSQGKKYTNAATINWKK